MTPPKPDEKEPTPTAKPGSLYVGPAKTAQLIEYITQRGKEVAAERASAPKPPVTTEPEPSRRGRR